MNRSTVLITGSRGLVGYALAQLLQKYFVVLRPDRSELNILKRRDVEDFLNINRPHVIIHAAAYVDAGRAEGERNNKEGLVYRTNVEGTRNVVEVAKNIGARVIYISTGSVFHGSKKNPGPFTESDPPIDNPDKNSWYGYTKYLGEKVGPDVTIRISHPIVPSHMRVKDDYVQKILHLYAEVRLFPLFPDQFFPLTSIHDLSHAIERILELKKSGIYHVASPDMVSPYEMTIFSLTTLKLPVDQRIKRLSIEEFYTQGNSQIRFAKYSALASTNTCRELQVGFTNWKNIVTQGIKILTKRE
jgi:dTDP-4-dehydrorhamnose reductase